MADSILVQDTSILVKKEYFTMDELKEHRVALHHIEIKILRHLHDINLTLDSANGSSRHLVLSGREKII